MNGNGYANLCRLITLAHEYDPLAPKISKSQLQVYAEDLICLSFSVVGELCTLLLEGRDEEARQVSDWYYSVFGDDYYYEIQNHGLPGSDCHEQASEPGLQNQYTGSAHQ